MYADTVIDVAISSKKTHKSRGCLRRTRRIVNAQTPEEGRRLFFCSKWVIAGVILASLLVINLFNVPTSSKNSQTLHFFLHCLFIFQIYSHWKQVRKLQPLFNDGVWFDNPPRGWDFCSICHTHRPPRSHHCPLCDSCILKRNHHCHFTGVCIGLGNQRNFVFFLFWIILACCYGLLLCAPLLSKHYIPLELSWRVLFGYFFPPFYIFMPLLGYSTWSGFFVMLTVAAQSVSLLFTSALLQHQIKLIFNNQTDYDHRKKNFGYSKGTIFNLRLIFGPHLILAFLSIFIPRLNVRSRERDCIYGRPQYTKIM